MTHLLDQNQGLFFFLGSLSARVRHPEFYSSDILYSRLQLLQPARKTLHDMCHTQGKTVTTSKLLSCKKMLKISEELFSLTDLVWNHFQNLLCAFVICFSSSYLELVHQQPRTNANLSSWFLEEIRKWQISGFLWDLNQGHHKDLSTLAPTKAPTKVTI